MSGYISGAVWLSGPKVRNLRYVLLAIADNANDSGFAWPSIEMIAEKCLISKSTVLRCLEDLEMDGWLSINRKAVEHKGNSYQIVLEKLTFQRPKSGVTMTPEIKESGVKTDKSQVSKSPKSGVKTDIVIRKNRHEPSLEPSLFKLQDPEFPTWLPVDEWKAYLDMRKKLRKPATDHAQDLLLKKLTGFHEDKLDVTAVLQQSIVSGYTDLYPPKNNGKGNGNGKANLSEIVRDTIHHMYAEDDQSVPD